MPASCRLDKEFLLEICFGSTMKPWEVVRYENFYAAGHDDGSEELKFLMRHSAAVVTLTAVETRGQLAKGEEWAESTMTVHRITQHR